MPSLYCPRFSLPTATSSGSNRLGSASQLTPITSSPTTILAVPPNPPNSLLR